VGGAIGAALIVGRVLAPPSSTGQPPVPARAPGAPPRLAVPRWQVDVGAIATVPELVAHPPVVVGDRVLVAGSQVGYVALDRAGGAAAWRRSGGATLAPPLVLSPHDVVLVRECDQPIAPPTGTELVACFERIDPLDVAGRAAGSVQTATPCPIDRGAWQIARDGGAVRFWRGACGYIFTPPNGEARRVEVPVAGPPDDGCDRLDDGTPWCQRVGAGASVVEVAGATLPGLSVLAAARDGRRAAVVVRADATLRHDVLYALDDGVVVWTWPLPEPTQARATPIGVSVSVADVLLLFDTSQVARFDAP